MHLRPEERRLVADIIEMHNSSQLAGGTSAHFQVIEFGSDLSLLVGPEGRESREVPTAAIRRLQLTGFIEVDTWGQAGFTFVPTDDIEDRYERLQRRSDHQ